MSEKGHARKISGSIRACCHTYQYGGRRWVAGCCRIMDVELLLRELGAIERRLKELQRASSHHEGQGGNERWPAWKILLHEDSASDELEHRWDEHGSSCAYR